MPWKECHARSKNPPEFRPNLTTRAGCCVVTGSLPVTHCHPKTNPSADKDADTEKQIGEKSWRETPAAKAGRSGPSEGCAEQGHSGGEGCLR
jgi:hypothetical protein